ncbi:hypothetical protein OG756_02120 [Streptomyces sp. NBC_01310]|uniref:hypothetical protein n=1 Tax=Streptomyces sp. NBC_01310 TaxID=2903820 RepID=UPI0035B597FF|nr:hypothetical protein OG756_02120 [Streptomyces sp. NBC_01310]
MAEEQAGVVVDLLEYVDGFVDDAEDDPLGVVAGELAMFEDPAGDLVPCSAG